MRYTPGDWLRNGLFGWDTTEIKMVFVGHYRPVKVTLTERTNNARHEITSINPHSYSYSQQLRIMLE